MLAYELSVEGSGFSIITLTLLMELDLLCGDDEAESLECGETPPAAEGETASAEKPEEGLLVGVEGKFPEKEILSMLSERLSSGKKRRRNDYEIPDFKGNYFSRLPITPSKV